jgi:hypothetical protein
MRARPLVCGGGPRDDVSCFHRPGSVHPAAGLPKGKPDATPGFPGSQGNLQALDLEQQTRLNS